MPRLIRRAANSKSPASKDGSSTELENASYSAASAPVQLHGLAIRYALRAFTRAVSQIAGDFGITPGQFRVLRTLGETAGLTQQELARLTAMDRPFVTLTIKQLREAGLVRVLPSPTDRRRVDVLLTPKGVRVREKLVAATLPSQGVAERGIAPQNLKIFHEVIAKMTENVEAYCEQLEQKNKERG